MTRLAVGDDGEGSATIAFGNVEGSRIAVPVDTRGTFVLRYRVGESGIAVGGGIDVLRRGQWDFRFGAMLQTENPSGAGYVVARTDRTDVQLRFSEVSDYFKRQQVLRLRSEGKKLEQGDEIVLRFGDRSAGGPGIVTHVVAHERRAIFVRSDVDGDGVFQRLPQTLYVDLVPREPHRLSLVAPSEVGRGGRFTLLLRVEDRNANQVDSFGDSIELFLRGGAVGLEVRDEVSGEFVREASVKAQPGALRVDARIVGEGVYWIEGRTEHGVRGTSNPIRVMSDVIPEALWWGDLHVHTFLSDGTDSLTQNYEFARDVAGIDFVAITDHLHPDPTQGETRLDTALAFAIRNQLAPSHTLQSWWSEQVAAAEKFHEPGRFTTLFAYEWSGRSPIGGDHNVYFAGPSTSRAGARVLPPLIAPQSLDSLYASLLARDRGDVVVIPHVGGRIANWNYHRPDIETALEICSVHGHFEWFAQEALSRGYRTAFVGAGDNHHGRPGYAVWQRFGRTGFKPRAYGVPNGLGAVRSATLDRLGVVRGLRRRRAYATTGVRIWLEFTINGRPMGGSLTTDQPPRLRVEVLGTAAIDRVEVIRDNSRIARVDGGGEWVIEKELVDATISPGWHYYYIRVTQADGELAWASPIWVNFTGDQVEERAHPAWNDDGSLDEWKDGEWIVEPELVARLKAALEAGAPNRYTAVEPIRSVQSRRGDYHVFFSRDRENDLPVRIRYYDGFSEPRLHIYPGWGDYGPMRARR